MKRYSIDGGDGNNNLDIISNLPSCIIENILICLPIKDAARTSILSTTWRFKWLSISQLVFGSVGDHNVFHLSTCAEKLWSIILQVLLVHRGPLRKLVIDVMDPVNNAFSLLDQIIIFLIGKDIQEFTLFPPLAEESPYTLPSTLFLCTKLTRLSLTDCIFRLPRQYIGFSKLVRVTLCWVGITAEDFNSFLSKCPLLQQLEFIDCQEGITIEIDAPNLKFLKFNCPESSLIFKNSPLLSVAKIVESARLLGQPSDIVHVFGSIPAIEHFSASEHFLMDLTAGITLERLPFMLNHLKCVEMLGLDLSSSKDVQFALLVIRSSPNLRKLKIQLLKNENSVDDTPIKSLCVAEDSFNQLREVTMEDFSGTMHELESIELLLSKLFILEKIIFQLVKGTTDKEIERILKAVTQFKRASPAVHIIFLDSEVSVTFFVFSLSSISE